jgi:hypothetical protein
MHTHARVILTGNRIYNSSFAFNSIKLHASLLKAAVTPLHTHQHVINRQALALVVMPKSQSLEHIGIRGRRRSQFVQLADKL